MSANEPYSPSEIALRSSLASQTDLYRITCKFHELSTAGRLSSEMHISAPAPRGHARNQFTTGTCWIQAGVALLESMMTETAPRLSVTFLYYHHMLGQTRRFCDRVEGFEAAKRPIYDSRDIQYSMSIPVTDGGTFDMFQHLVQEHGVVPQDSYKRAYAAKNTEALVWHINDYLRTCAPSLRSREITKDSVIGAVERALRIALGDPPDEVDGKAPKEFLEGNAKETAKPGIEQFKVICNAPDRPYGVWYDVNISNDDTRPYQHCIFNLPAVDFVAACVKMLRRGLPVWITGDVSHMFDGELGHAHEELYWTREFLTLNRLGGDIEARKCIRMNWGATAPVHAMLVTGVRLGGQDNAPVGWRILNSHGVPELEGEEFKADGSIIASHRWFEEFVIEAAVVPEGELSAAMTNPDVQREKREAWDVLGTAAT